MATLYLDRKHLELRHEGQHLTLYESGQRRGTVPLTLLERVVMRGEATLTSGALTLMADAGVTLLVLSGRKGHTPALLQGNWHGDTRRRIAQYRWYFEQGDRLQWAIELLARKLDSQARFLEEPGYPLNPARRAELNHALNEAAGQVRETLRGLRQAPLGEMTLARLNGLEGSAAAAYFGAYFRLFPPAFNLNGRNRRPPRDPVNAALSLGYTLLHADAARACQLNGLDPYVGFYHEPAYRRESLASDLMEPLRVEIDRWVWRLFADRDLRLEDFTSESGGGCLMKKNARALFYARYEGLAKPLRRLLRRNGLAVARRLLEPAS